MGEASAMTDLDTTLAIIQEMHFVPITRDGLLWLAAANAIGPDARPCGIDWTKVQFQRREATRTVNIR